MVVRHHNLVVLENHQVNKILQNNLSCIIIIFVDCSHVIVTAFFIEAIENPNAFSSLKCDSYENFLIGVCNENESVTVGGNLVGVDGSFFFQTNPQKPYSMS